MNLFRTQFEQWLDNYECDLAIAFDNQTEYDSFNAFIKAEYKTMLENEQQATYEARDGVLSFNTTN